jgi:hypothetical protein
MVISIVVLLAHCPLSGVKVYVDVPTVAVEIFDGFHVPGIAGKLFELAGKIGAMLFLQSGPIGSNVGVINGLIVISNVAILAHSPLSGVNVYVAVPGVAVEIIVGFQVP